MRASVLAAAADPMQAMQYLAELDDPAVSHDDLALRLAAEMTKTDVKLFAAVVTSCKGPEGSKIVAKIQAQALFGCGRQAIRHH